MNRPIADPMADIGVVAAELGCPHWDVALVGDGGGNMWDRPIGWACILIDRYGGGPVGPRTLDARRMFTGGMNCGTLQVAELMPYVHAMLWYDQYHGKLRREQLGRPELTVLVITDNQAAADLGAAVRAGGERAAAAVRKHPLLATLAHWGRVGYRFEWAHIRRQTLALNALADRQADLSKRAAANALVQAAEYARDRLPDAPTDAELTYLFQSEAFRNPAITRPIHRRTYKPKRPPKPPAV